MKKRILSILMVLAMAMGMLPGTALAEEEETQPFYLYTKVTSMADLYRGYQEDISYLVVNQREAQDWVLTSTTDTLNNTSGLVCIPVDKISSNTFISNDPRFHDNLWKFGANNTGNNYFFPADTGIYNSMTIAADGNVILGNNGGAYHDPTLINNSYFLLKYHWYGTIPDAYLDHYYGERPGFVAAWAPPAGQEDSLNRRWTLYKAERVTGNNVIYDLNGGSCTAFNGSQSKVVAIDETVTEYSVDDYQITVPSSGQVFLGWKINGSGQLYQAGDSIPITSQITKLVAQYAVQQEAYFFLRTDGVIPPEDGTTQYANAQYIPSVHTRLPGKVTGETQYTEFTGVINADGTINGVKLSEAFRLVEENITEYPTDDAIKAVLANNGYDSDEYGYAWYVIKQPTLCSHLHVDGVLYKKSGSSSSTPEFRVINYVRNDGETAPISTVFEKGYSATLESPESHSTLSDSFFSREGYTFLGWSTSNTATAADPAYTGDNVSCTMDSDLTLYAVWKPITLSYTVKHIVEGAEQENDTATYTQPILETTNHQLAVQEGSITPKTYAGYTYTSMDPDVKVGSLVDDETVISLFYEKDDTLTTELTYHIEYRVDSTTGTLLDQEDVTVTIWAGDTDYIVSSIPNKSFAGYSQLSDASTALPATVQDNDTIYVIYQQAFYPYIPHVDHSQTENKPALNTEEHFAYIIGYEDGTVKPESNITRAEVATIFFRLLTDESRSAFWSQVNEYSDVSSTAWYNNAVSTMTNAGIITGYLDGTFRPDAPITRAEFAAIAARFSDVVYNSDSTFTDVPENHWAAHFIALAEHLGWINGYLDGSFKPNQAITRAEAMTLINRVLERAVEKEHLLPDMVTWVDNRPGDWYYEAVQEATNSHEYVRLNKLVTDQSFCYEDWMAILPSRDWAALEKLWVDMNG